MDPGIPIGKKGVGAQAAYIWPRSDMVTWDTELKQRFGDEEFF